MKVEFGNPPNSPAGPVDAAPAQDTPAASPAVDTTPAQGIPTVPAGAVAVRPTRAQAAAEKTGGFNDEDIGFDDIILPRLNIVQGVGDLSAIFNPGELVLNQSLVIHVPANPVKKVAGTPPLNFTVIGFKRRQFVEKTVGGAMGNLFGTEQEVADNGGTLDYNEALRSGKTLYQRLATALLLIEKPEHIDDEDHVEFPNECEGKFYALALWSMKGTSYTNAAKLMFTARKLGHLKRGYAKQAWTLTTQLRKFGENFAHVPILRAGARHTDEFDAFVTRVLSSGESSGE